MASAYCGSFDAFSPQSVELEDFWSHEPNEFCCDCYRPTTISTLPLPSGIRQVSSYSCSRSSFAMTSTTASLSISAADSARTAFNLKVLRRHDPSIVSIISTASFVVLYLFNSSSSEWTKTGVEGPLFLFRRRLPPYNGFFLMNRNGVENFSADVTGEDDLEITPEFIIYRPRDGSGSGEEGEVYGIWVFEGEQRAKVGEMLLELQGMEGAPREEEVKAALEGDKSTESGTAEKAGDKSGKSSKQNGKPKRGGKEKQADKKEAAAPAAPAEAETNGENGTTISLDDLFGAPAPAAASAAPAVPLTERRDTTDPATEEGPNLLDTLFQSTSLSESTPAPADQTNTLLALLGNSTSAPAPASQPNETTPPAPKMTELLESATHSRIGLGDDGQPLSKRDFVTELLSMIHTNPDFVTELHNSYLARVA